MDTARLYSVPRVPPPVYVSGFGEKSARLAARIADGYICMGPQADLIKLYRDEGGAERPVQGGIKACWAPDAGDARATVHRLGCMKFDLSAWRRVRTPAGRVARRTIQWRGRGRAP